MPTSPSRNASPSARATLDKVAARTPDGVTLFDNLSLTFGPERTGVVGRNGAGKSTLLRLLSGASAPAEGVVARTGSVGVLDQRYDPAPNETAAQTLGVAQDLAVIARVLAGEGTADDLARADWTLEARLGEALAAVGLSAVALERPTVSLSGGEQTRLRLAGLMLAQPDLILLDEPTSALDVSVQQQVLKLLAELQQRYGMSYVFISHDLAVVRAMSHRVMVMKNGDVIEEGEAQALFDAPQQPYTKALLAAAHLAD